MLRWNAQSVPVAAARLSGQIPFEYERTSRACGKIAHRWGKFTTAADADPRFDLRVVLFTLRSCWHVVC